MDADLFTAILPLYLRAARLTRLPPRSLSTVGRTSWRIGPYPAFRHAEATLLARPWPSPPVVAVALNTRDSRLVCRRGLIRGNSMVSGQANLEYVGLTVLVAAVIAGLVSVTPLRGVIVQKFGTAICKATQREGCGHDEPHRRAERPPQASASRSPAPMEVTNLTGKTAHRVIRRNYLTVRTSGRLNPDHTEGCRSTRNIRNMTRAQGSMTAESQVSKIMPSSR